VPASIAHALPVPTDPPPADGILRYLGVDGCVRLPLRADAQRLRAELDRLPADTWSRANRDPVVQASVVSFYAIGYPRGPRPLPAEDRPVMGALPALRELLRRAIPGRPSRAIVARLAPLGLIPIHTDTPRFFRGTIRLSIQVAADGVQRLYCNRRFYDLAPGEVWAIDNLRPHGIHNPSARPRTNVLVDVEPSDEMIALIAAGDHGLGATDGSSQAALEAMSKERYRRMRWRGVGWELFKRLWRRV
jgi:aspartyl/asparaginyl beta-hydroxylase